MKRIYKMSGYSIQVEAPGNDLNSGTYQLLRKACAVADEGGTIQAAQAVGLFADPRHHTTMSLQRAVSLIHPGAELIDL